ncbi:MAG TPA: Uma2 family endonuclease [Kofleriaceae bacterium]
MRTWSGDVRTKHPATYKDVLRAPENQVAELIGRTLYLSPRPKGPQASVAAYLGANLITRFGSGGGGRNRWLILAEPELHLGQRVVVPDLAGWKRRRMNEVPLGHKFTIVPDWVCEIASPGTATHDRHNKMPLYAEAGVKHVWLITPLPKMLEVYRLVKQQWVFIGTHVGNERVRAEPFDDALLSLSRLWSDIPKKASEPYEAYYAR